MYNIPVSARESIGSLEDTAMDTIFIFKSSRGYTVGLCYGEGTKYPSSGRVKNCKWGYTALAYIAKLQKEYPTFVIRESSKKLIASLQVELQ